MGRGLEDADFDLGRARGLGVLPSLVEPDPELGVAGDDTKDGTTLSILAIAIA